MKNFFKTNLIFIAFIINASASLLTDFLAKEINNFYIFVIYLFLGSILLFIVYFKIKLIDKKIIIYLSILFLYLFFSSFYGDVAYGIEKLFLSIIAPLCSLLLLNMIRISKDDFLESLMVVFVIVLVSAILWKINYGFFFREVRFGFFGSITFGWMMSLASILSIVQYIANKKTINITYALAFTIAVFWSGSKGPLLSLITIIFLVILINAKNKGKITFITLITLLYYYGFEYLENFRAIRSLITLIDDPENYIEGVGSGSIGIRLEMYSQSYKIFINNLFFGIGFGAWSNYVSIEPFLYPHNIVLEVASELGIIGLLIVLVTLKRGYYLSSTIFKYLISYLLLAMMFSGDFSYFRYIIFFIIVQNIFKKRKDYV